MTRRIIRTNTNEAALQARIQELEAKLEAAKPKPRDLSLKVSEKGAVSVYGLGRFPVTLYGEQWTRLIQNVSKISAFLEENKTSLASKS